MPTRPCTRQPHPSMSRAGRNQGWTDIGILGYRAGCTDIYQAEVQFRLINISLPDIRLKFKLNRQADMD